MDFPRTIGREKLRPLLVAVFVVVIPLVHLGCPLLIDEPVDVGRAGGLPFAIEFQFLI